MQGGEGGHLGATWLTLAEKVTLAQGAIGGCRAPLLPRFSSIVCMLRGEPRAMGVTSQRKAKSTFSAGCCPRGLLNVAARLLRWLHGRPLLSLVVVFKATGPLH